MGYATPFDPLLRFAFYSGLAVFILTLALLLAIVLLRFASDRRRRREAELTARWQPVFLHAVEGLPYEAPRVLGRDREIILLLWIHFSELLRGTARDRLRQLARELQLIGTAQRLLQRGDMRGRLLAVVGLGRMHAIEAWPELAALIDNPNSTLSLLAARSLLQIDRERAAPVVMPMIGRREDWSSSRLAAMFGEGQAEDLAPHLLRALQGASAKAARPLLALLDVVHAGDRWPVLAPFLGNGQAPDTVVAALRVCNDPRALAAVRGHCVHADWSVRAQAATTLGKLGRDEDKARLQSMLSDTEWWVRYRAAQALAQMPGTTERELGDLLARLEDRFAADMLRQVLAESAAGVAS